MEVERRHFLDRLDRMEKPLAFAMPDQGEEFEDGLLHVHRHVSDLPLLVTVPTTRRDVVEIGVDFTSLCDRGLREAMSKGSPRNGPQVMSRFCRLVFSRSLRGGIGEG